MTPVSYTHLDVYKRQPPPLSKSTDETFVGAYPWNKSREAIGRDRPLTPVSYTHLDVYKRQAGKNERTSW